MLFVVLNAVVVLCSVGCAGTRATGSIVPQAEALRVAEEEESPGRWVVLMCEVLMVLR
jgi:hypothetical protein